MVELEDVASGYRRPSIVDIKVLPQPYMRGVSMQSLNFGAHRQAKREPVCSCMQHWLLPAVL